MSKDYRQQLIRSMEVSLASAFDAEEIEIVTRKLISVLGNYDVIERHTELVEYDFGNDRIIKRYLACIMVDGKSEHTIYGYNRAMIRFSEFAMKPLKDVTAYDIRYYLASEKERGVSNATIENTRAYISAFYQWMTDDEIIPKNPCSAVKPIKCPDMEKKPFSDVEMDALRSACRNFKERAIIEVLSSSGIRVAELSNMNVSDIDFQDRCVHVRNGKGGKDRTTYISDVAKLHLQRYINSRKDNCIALICNKNKSRINTGGIRHILRQLGNRADIDNVHPHRFRRTFATNLAKRGMAIQEIQKLLGHSNIATTMEYVCVDNAKVQASYRQHIA